jgi:hypothetical protein
LNLYSKEPMLIDILNGGVEKTYWCHETQVRRIVERSLIDSSHYNMPACSSLQVSGGFSKKRHLYQGSSTRLYWLGSSWLLAVSKTQECAERKHISNIEGIKTSAKKILTNIPVQNFKNCFEHGWSTGNTVRNWRAITSKNSRLLISTALKISF